MFLSRSGNSFGSGARNTSKRLSGGSKNHIFGPDPKIGRAPCFWAVLAIVLGQEPEMLQTGFLEVPKTRYSVQTKNSFRAILLSRSGNGFMLGARNASKQSSGGASKRLTISMKVQWKYTRSYKIPSKVTYEWTSIHRIPIKCAVDTTSSLSMPGIGTGSTRLPVGIFWDDQVCGLFTRAVTVLARRERALFDFAHLCFRHVYKQEDELYAYFRQGSSQNCLDLDFDEK